MNHIRTGIAIILVVAAAVAATTQEKSTQEKSAPAVPEYVAPVVQRLTAKTVRTYDAPEATQGVAASRRFFYAIDNTILAKYDIVSGRFVDRWVGPRRGLVRHMNSCLVDAKRVWCANSNYSLTPMGSSVEVFDAETLAHVDTHSLGMTDEGSLTWFDRYNGGWIAGYAHYDESGSVGFKNHRFSSVVTYDAEWRRTGGWLLPASALERMAPYAASGGAIGPDGWLYLLGHDRPEMYVVARPSMGPTLIHLATIDLDAEGQAFAWAQDGTRTIYAIDRKNRRVLNIEVPPVNAADVRDALPFRRLSRAVRQ
jgi:hypothetical protein